MHRRRDHDADHLRVPHEYAGTGPDRGVEANADEKADAAVREQRLRPPVQQLVEHQTQREADECDDDVNLRQMRQRRVRE